MTPPRTTRLVLVLLACVACEPTEPAVAPLADIDSADSPPPPPPPRRIARAESLRGETTLERDGERIWLESGAALRTADIVRVPDGGGADVVFDDGGRLTFIGPASFAVGELSATGRRLMLVRGVVSPAAAHDIPIEIQTPHDPSLVLQNCSALVRVLPGDRIVFQRLAPGHAQVWSDAKQSAQDLGDAEFVLDLSASAEAK